MLKKNNHKISGRIHSLCFVFYRRQIICASCGPWYALSVCMYDLSSFVEIFLIFYKSSLWDVHCSTTSFCGPNRHSIAISKTGQWRSSCMWQKLARWLAFAPHCRPPHCRRNVLQGAQRYLLTSVSDVSIWTTSNEHFATCIGSIDKPVVWVKFGDLCYNIIWRRFCVKQLSLCRWQDQSRSRGR